MDGGSDLCKADTYTEENTHVHTGCGIITDGLSVRAGRA
jgi:hypothetical protein